MPYARDYLEKINYLYDELNEEEVIGLINFILERNLPNKEKIKNIFSGILEENNAPYRIINGMVQPFSDKEITAILENAYQHAPNEIIRKHLVNAERLYSDANSFDYRTSCQESINALEACLQFFYKNKDRLGQNINRLEKDGKYDKHIVQCAKKIYAFRNDNTAHANKSNGYQPDKEDALLIHTLCCGFVYYFRNKK
jgi:arsenate reductase-like glutaredoxin family protein